MGDVRFSSESDWASTDDESLRGSLVPILRTVSPLVLVVGLVWLRVDRPWAPAVAVLHIGDAVLLGVLAIHWSRRPPASVNAAAAGVVVTLYACATAAMVAWPDPIVCLLPLIIATGTMMFMVDHRWMMAAQTFGAVGWIGAVSLAPPSPQWPLVGFAVFIGVGAAASFRLARNHGLRRVHALREAGRERELAIRQVASALRASEAQLVEAQRIAQVGSYSWDHQAQRLVWSEEHYRILGLRREDDEITIERFVERVHPEDRAPLAQALADSLHGRSPVDVEFRIRREDGEERVLHGRGETTFDENGTPIRHAGTSLDITEIKRAEEAHRASDERLLAIVQALDMSKVVVIDRQGVVGSILGKPERTGVYGIGVDNVTGRSIQSFLPGAEGERARAAIAQVFDTHVPSDLDAVVELPTGTFHFDVSLRPLHDGAGNVESVLAILRDVTERAQAARALEQARKLESLGVLAGGIAHDFNNLLVGILGNSEVALREAGDAPRLRGALEHVLQSSERAAELTQHLLAYAGKAELSIQPANLALLVDEAVQLLRASVSGGANIVVEHGSAEPWVNADVTQLSQVVMNFVTNAAESLQDACGSVRIRTGLVRVDRDSLDRCKLGNQAAEGDFVFLEVADDGAGMHGPVVERIFDPFFTTKFQGRGLGMASTLGIVRSHGGAIGVESEPGRGTTFRVLLPRGAPGQEKPDPIAPAERDGAGVILVVDDETTVRDTTARMLTAQGYEVIQAASGTQALDLLGSMPVDAALLDVTMPDMGGVEVFEAIRATLPELPVVFMSGHSQEDVAQRVSGWTRITQVQKPFRLAELSDAVQNALRA